MRPSTPLADLTEKQWDAQLFASRNGVATTLGWKLVYHTLRSKGSRSGFPDRVLVRDRVIYAELKREDGKPTDTQQEWLTGLAAAGAEVYLWRPSDLDEIAKVLGKRWTLLRAMHFASASAPELGIANDGQGMFTDCWTPKSLWLPAGRRNDHHTQQTIAA